MFHGVCPTCSAPFKSYHATKKYCSRACYVKSPQFRDQHRLDAETHRKNKTRICRQCGVEFMDCQKKVRNKCCSKLCRRKWYADRFTRWAANPGEISLPENFDDFLLQPTLPCLVKGCDWRGEALGLHMNKEHGISAEEVKRIVGFNQGTGMVNPRLLEFFVAHGQKTLLANSPEMWIKDSKTASEMAKKGGKTARTAEWLAHSSKSSSFLNTQRNPDVEVVCRECGVSFFKRVINRSIYCSRKCRQTASDKRRLAKIICSALPRPVCANCGRSFDYRHRSQAQNARKGIRVFCGRECWHETDTKEKRQQARDKKRIES